MCQIQFLSETDIHKWPGRRETDLQSGKIWVEAELLAETYNIWDNFLMFPQRGSLTLQDAP